MTHPTPPPPRTSADRTGPAAPPFGTADAASRTDRSAELLTRTLVAYGNMPEPLEIARLTDALLTHGQELLPAAERARGADRRVAGALRDWARLTTEGPEDTSLGNWNHARALARAVRTLRRGLDLPVPETPKERAWVDWDTLPPYPDENGGETSPTR
ncbi:DUF6415 family natural product biosynthesis protein [Streptomyces sp. NPDC097619]|uniref:DUF6415 family natural product biosynthesis protein n=1 Tax=Streptomyces sp. NPDC097619 TaxID=3157228 RepID=UPI00331AA891